MKTFILITLLIIGTISFIMFLVELILSIDEPKEISITIILYSLISSLTGLFSFSLILYYIDKI